MEEKIERWAGWIWAFRLIILGIGTAMFLKAGEIVAILFPAAIPAIKAFFGY